ncbi:MAG TPA: hypothetical protein VM942_08875 [Acidimicrobiales bacterium]|nr:hypothetical protein [Acidimicrobiales bacterium]
MSRRGRLLGLAGWAIGIGCALAMLAASGHGALSPPPLGSPGRWQEWFEQREPVSAAFAIVRMAAVGACWYLVVTSVVGTVLRLLRADVLVTFTDAFTVAPIRRLLAGSLTLTLAGIGPTATLAAAQPAPSTTSTTSVATSTSTSTPPSSTSDTIVMRRLPPPVAEPDQPAPSPSTTPTTGRWTVRPGDCFWTIAEDLLRRAWGRSPSDAEIVPYWQRLIEANRSELAHPADPDLIFPDQVFTVPPVPPAG